MRMNTSLIRRIARHGALRIVAFPLAFHFQGILERIAS